MTVAIPPSRLVLPAMMALRVRLAVSPDCWPAPTLAALSFILVLAKLPEPLPPAAPTLTEVLPLSEL